MATDLVTIEEAKLWCRVDSDDEDETFATLIGAASEAVLSVADGWDGSDPVPDRIKLAVLTHVAQAFDNRENGAALPVSAGSLLSPLRNLDL